MKMARLFQYWKELRTLFLNFSWESWLKPKKKMQRCRVHMVHMSLLSRGQNEIVITKEFKDFLYLFSIHYSLNFENLSVPMAPGIDPKTTQRRFLNGKKKKKLLISCRFYGHSMDGRRWRKLRANLCDWWNVSSWKINWYQLTVTETYHCENDHRRTQKNLSCRHKNNYQLKQKLRVMNRRQGKLKFTSAQTQRLI